MNLKNNMTEKELIEALANDSEDAFRIIFDRYYQGLLRFAVSYTEDSHIAEDLVQDSFIIFWEKYRNLEEESNIHALLVRIVKFKVWAYVEKQRQRIIIEKSIYDDVVREMDLKLSSLDSIDTTSLYINEVHKIIKDTLQGLPELTREIFLLSREEYLTNKEIAEKINLSEKSIEYHISKTLKLLRSTLSPYLKFIIFYL